MTTFDDLHKNIVEYKQAAIQLSDLCLQVSSEKAKGQQMVYWFRGRNRRINQVLIPLEEEAKRLQKQTLEFLNDCRDAKIAIQRASNLVEREESDQAQALIERDVSPHFEVGFDLRYDAQEKRELLSSLDQTINREMADAQTDIEYYKEVEQVAKRAIDVFQTPKKTVDVDYDEFERTIREVNEKKNGADIDLPDLQSLPTEYINKTVINNLHERIRELVSQIDSLFPRWVMKEVKPCIRKIIHDVGNDRGQKAFTNRSSELLSATNKGIETFNNKYWQITGQRWERVGTNKHGYRTVKPTHEAISIIA